MSKSITSSFEMTIERDEQEPFEVTVEFTWRAGCAPIVSGPADNWDPGCPDEAEILSVIDWDGKPFELTDAEMKKAEDLALEKGGEAYTWDDREFEREP